MISHVSSNQLAAPLRVGIVGAGPAGLFAADAFLTQSEVPVEVDLIERLPAPFGLVRYGVAPDHPTIKSVVSTFEAILLSSGARLVGGVDVGSSIGAGELRECYDVVVYATGAATDRRLGIDGEDLPGSVSATEVVSWYNGHPDALAQVLTAGSVAVIGAGNVALDIARLLVSPYDRLAQTDIPTATLPAFARSAVRDVQLIARRGPAEAKFSTKELRELALVDGVSVTAPAADVAGVDAIGLDRRAAANLRVFESWTEPVAGRGRTVSFRFFERPVAIHGENRVTGLEVQRTRPGGQSERLVRPVEMVVRAIGYRGVPIAGVPFESSGGVVPNAAGRVVGLDGRLVAGVYVTGWLKRGPSGVIGTNKQCAHETVASILTDCHTGAVVRAPDRPRLTDVLQRRRLAASDARGWRAIDEEERRRGAAEGRGRSKISDWATLRELAHRTELQPT
jgi:ferredoxin/flavodoxin---NADP+ reductase